jgi:hypothetical protein
VLLCGGSEEFEDILCERRRQGRGMSLLLSFGKGKEFSVGGGLRDKERGREGW